MSEYDAEPRREAVPAPGPAHPEGRPVPVASETAMERLRRRAAEVRAGVGGPAADPRPSAPGTGPPPLAPVMEPPAPEAPAPEPLAHERGVAGAALRGAQPEADEGHVPLGTAAPSATVPLARAGARRVPGQVPAGTVAADRPATAGGAPGLDLAEPARAPRDSARAVDLVKAETQAAGAASDLEGHAPTRGRRALMVVAILLALAVAASAVGLGLLLRSRARTSALGDDRVAVTAAARKLLVDFTDLDYRRIDEWLKRVQDDSGPGLRADFTVRREALDAVARSSQIVTKGEVLQATAQVTGSTATALVITQTRAMTKDVPAGRATAERYLLRLQKLDGRWQPVSLDPVATQALS